jgi:hypothetical protein
MANTDMPNGAVPCDAHGGHYVGSVNLYHLPATESNDVAVGDFVDGAGSADSDGVPTITRSSAGSTNIVGVVVGFKPDASYLDDTHRTASTARYAYVADDPDQLFSIQESGAIAATDVSGNADILATAVTTATGMSNMELNSASVTTSTAQLRILRLDPSPDNEIGTNARWIVRINEHLYGKTAGV